MSAPSRIVPLLAEGVLAVEGTAAPSLSAGAAQPLPAPGRYLVEPLPEAPLTVTLDERSVTIRPGGWSGELGPSRGGRVTGRARDDLDPGRDVTVLALATGGVVARATARAADGGRFTLDLPATVARAPYRTRLTIGIAGSDHVLGRVDAGRPPRAWGPAPEAPRLRIKISTPNLREAPLWGDSHFAASLAAAFERLGRPVGVDCMDAWYGRTAPEDAVLVIRGRQPVQLDPGKINLMWLISHPDRVEDAEYAQYDRVFVASDIYAAHLKDRGLPHVEVLHQATDAVLFGGVAPPETRRSAPVFVGNSRREYRTMVKWCVEQGVPLDLYGGGWDGVLPPGYLRAPSVANRDLPALYAAHGLLLNDHWDSMRDNGFLSNRLFDGSATGTPILTDPVAGLEAVFGDTIATASEPEAFAEIIRSCLDDPTPFLARAARAREIVLGAHTFDHRAATLAAAVDRIAAG
ncbi:CgeB family protein [Jannaschia seohaensis]|uniref:Glycosyl transferase family 1 n=1 Tax=Jannaschia seohaensis TaxID=475081 RepID=A0A2Y9B422_9RHOB|nr:glycosyltransferase [Jannaschia seohaensis]PWJ12947.1 glycosyl transferase family 1 [Jannaschia seohaensis]SSA50755.1 Glycosyl transferases group 1 [Jannaschia seohaensis]